MAAYGLIPENITHVITPVRTALMNRINNTLGCNFVLEPDHCTEKQGLNNWKKQIWTANCKELYYGNKHVLCTNVQNVNIHVDNEKRSYIEMQKWAIGKLSQNWRLQQKLINRTHLQHTKASKLTCRNQSVKRYTSLICSHKTIEIS